MSRTLYIADVYDFSNILQNTLSTATTNTWDYTDLKVIKSSYTWTIKNFSFCPHQCIEKLESPVFTAGSEKELEFRLRLYPRGRKQEFRKLEFGSHKKYIEVYLGLVFCRYGINNVPTTFKIAFRNTRRNEIKSLATRALFKRNHFKGWVAFLDRDYLFASKNDLLPEDKLIVYCEITSTVSNIDTHLGERLINFKILNTLSQDLDNLFKTKKLSDLIINVHGKEIPAHKFVLAARSPVFAAMLDHDMLERNLSKVDIKDFELQVIEEMLHFMYTGKVFNVEKDMVKHLLIASDKYGLYDLKKKCERALTLQLTACNAAEILDFADKFNALQLKEYCLDYIRGHITNILSSPGWTSIVNSQVHLLEDVIRAIGIQFEEKLEIEW